mmetsp:Transcript_21329/g.19405  ORF Transcript_21329/g.19405 Transcript_21329/m.19405 type:complete len:150 (+) Transcript_21329:49-498(+)
MSDWKNEYFGTTLLTKNGVVSTNDVLNNKKLIGIYFSAHWCPPCRGFTPVLSKFYEDFKEQDLDGLEIIFVSSDSDDDSFDLYYKEQPWVALPFDDKDHSDSLSNKYDVSGIPSLIILDGVTGKIKDRDGRTTISQARGDINKSLIKWN